MDQSDPNSPIQDPAPTTERNTMEHHGTENTESPTQRQLNALPYLLAAPTIAEGARMASIGRTTLYRWMNDPDFKHRLEKMRADAANLARTEIKGLMLKSVLVVAEALEDPSPAVRLRAAQTALAMGFKADDLQDMAKRMERVDDALHLWTSKNTNW
jgi:hypothetical protein